MKLTAVIVDDEIKLHSVLIELLKENCPEIDVIGTSTNMDNAYELIMSKRPQVVFLDIEMPGGSGFDLLQKFNPIFFETVF
ncbi:MAG TPA: response regulator, partial [Bacteroidia bacterium]|nr:response regulator [Bacteroidia bacterium]